MTLLLYGFDPYKEYYYKSYPSFLNVAIYIGSMCSYMHPCP